MNHKSTLFWESYWEEKSGKTPDHASVSAWAFGADPDHLLDLVQQGKKNSHLFWIPFLRKRTRAASKTRSICGHFGQQGGTKSHHRDHTSRYHANE